MGQIATLKVGSASRQSQLVDGRQLASNVAALHVDAAQGYPPKQVAFVCNGISFFSLLKLLSLSDLSFAVPATAASIVVETIAAHWVLGENVTRERWFGAAAVAVGVWLLAGS